MKMILTALALVGALCSTGHAAIIESDLQAIVLSKEYASAAALATTAVSALGQGYVATIGNTSTLKIGGPRYFYHIPVFAVSVPLSPIPPKNVGNIVAELEVGLNSPVPTVLGVYFSPAPSNP